MLGTTEGLSSSAAPRCHRGPADGLRLRSIGAVAGRDHQNRPGWRRPARSAGRSSAGNYVTFVNADSRPHAIASDPVDLHTQCPALNRVGIIPPGESRESGTLTEKTACGFHDHNDPADTALKGRIVVD